jgi:hypothetical protein
MSAEEPNLTAEDDIADINSSSRFLHLIGYVMYEDENGGIRRTGFFRYYDAKRRRFRAIGDGEYEFQE